MKHNIITSTLAAALMFGFTLTATAQGLTDEADNQNTPSGWQAVALPQLPTITASNTFDITSYGASESSTDNAEAIQKALDAVPSTGGMVVIPAGTYLSGPLKVKSKTILYLKKGATLMQTAYGTYPEGGINFIQTASNNNTDIILEGEDQTTSIIDGQGEDWWALRDVDRDNMPARGSLIRFTGGQRFLIKNLTLKNAPGTNLTLGQSGRGSHFTVHDVTIQAPSSEKSKLVGDETQVSHNTDGIPVWAPYVNIYNCNISNGDDNVVIDSNGQYVHVWNCEFGNGHGASIGSYTSNIHDVIFEKINFNGTDAGIRMKTSKERSGELYNIVYRDIVMTNVDSPISFTLHYDEHPNLPLEAEEITSSTPVWHDILIQNVVSTGTPANSNVKRGYPIYVYGRAESPIKNLVFDNVNVDAKKGMFLAYCDVSFINGCKINGYDMNEDTNLKITRIVNRQQDANISFTKAEEKEDDDKEDTKDITTLVLDNTTIGDNDNKTWTFTNGCTITQGKSKGYSAAGNRIKFSRNVQFTINLPSDIKVDSVKFDGFCNSKTEGATSYLKELNGETYSENTYAFPYKTSSTANTIVLTTPASGSITFTPAGEDQSAFAITLYGSKATGISGISEAQPTASQRIYTLSGSEVKQASTPGIYIQGGKKYVVK